MVIHVWHLVIGMATNAPCAACIASTRTERITSVVIHQPNELLQASAGTCRYRDRIDGAAESLSCGDAQPADLT